MPALVDERKVFIAETPLYEITAGKDTLFAYSEAEKNTILGGIKGKHHIQRSKGLGENEPEMMWQTTMNPASRKLVMVMPDDESSTQDTFDVLLGDNLRGRKELIEARGHEYLEFI